MLNVAICFFILSAVSSSECSLCPCFLSVAGAGHVSGQVGRLVSVRVLSRSCGEEAVEGGYWPCPWALDVMCCTLTHTPYTIYKQQVVRIEW